MYRWGPTVIETARKAAGLSQYELAQRARTKQSSVSEYEARKKSPTLDVAERLLDAAEAELVVRPTEKESLKQREGPSGQGILAAVDSQRFPTWWKGAGKQAGVEQSGEAILGWQVPWFS